MAWTQEQKDAAIKQYKAGNPTPETSAEIIKEIAESMEQSPNGVRMILVASGDYVKKDPATAAATTSKDGKPATGAKTTRVSKEVQIKALTDAILNAGIEAEVEILEKLTGKAAVYFLKVVTEALAKE
jgi:hypothetical protein